MFNSFESCSQKRGSTLRVIFKKRFNSLSFFFLKKSSGQNEKKVQFFESCKKEVHMKERFNSLSILRKKRCNSLGNIGKQERFNSLSHIENRLQPFESS